MENIILASASPRRRELLSLAGVDFAVEPSKREEKITKTAPDQVVEELALQKAMDVAEGHPEDCLVIGSDTVVAQEGRIFGKPMDEAQALEMLSALQGREHQVYTGVAVVRRQGGVTETRVFHEKAQVWFYPATQEELKAYIATGEPMDKAGAYGIQGSFAAYLQKICGDYNTIVGFPLGRFFHEMKQWGVEIRG